MSNIKYKLSLAAVFCGLLICFAAAQRASAQVPGGSYQKSCRDFKTAGAVLSAWCGSKDKQSTLSKITGAGAPFEYNPGTKLENYFECDGDIWNDDSQLKCSRNRNSAPMKAARTAINTAYRSVTGFDVSGEAHLTVLIKMMFERGMQQKFFGAKYAFMIADADLVKIFKDDFAKTPIVNKRALIERAYTYVYGRGPGAEQIARYLNQNIAFSEIIAAEQQLMKSDSTNLLRGIAIVNAYKDSMGRPPTAAERNYWNPKTTFYNVIVKANRDFLYSPNGSKDLLETIKRAHNATNGKNPDSVQLANLLTKYSQNKAIFDEMK